MRPACWLLFGLQNAKPCCTQGRGEQKLVTLEQSCLSSPNEQELVRFPWDA